MRVPTEDIPQADILQDVINTVVAVSEGATTYQDIAEHIGKVGRQGRYYRKAAEIVGLIKNVGRNYSVLTQAGQSFVQNNPSLQNPVLLHGVLNARIFQRVIPFLESKGGTGVNKSELEKFLIDVADIADMSTAPRRLSSVVSWLVELGIVTISGSRYVLSNSVINQRVPLLNFDNADEPLMPSAQGMNDYHTIKIRYSSAGNAIQTIINSAAFERANNAHQHLVDLTAERIKLVGALPKSNLFIDLATHYNSTDFIFEMKSTTQENEKSQLRAGLSQLYEYRYLQNKPEAKLVLVIENPLSSKEQWRQDYLESDRDVYLLWDGDEELFGNERTKNDLSFLGVK